MSVNELPVDSTHYETTSKEPPQVEETKTYSFTANKLQKNSKKLPEYTSAHYEPLGKQAGVIRVLKLLSSNDDNPQVECELINTSLDDKRGHTPYEALSWCWGNSPEAAYISVRKNGKIYAKYVRKDLVSALRALRHYHKDRCLWIDAVCIDQSHTEEKNHQVEMMSEIYGKADRVCIWLGDPTESSRLAIGFIKNEVLQLQNFDDLCDKKADTTKWNALLELMQRPWFSRRWVVQEIALARKALMYCGTDRISWRKFAVAVELFVEVETATHRLSEVMKKDPKYFHVPGWFEYVSALGASLLVDATGRLFRDYKQLKQCAKSATDQEVDLDLESEPDSDLEALTDDESEDGSLLARVNSEIARGQPLLSLEYLVSCFYIFDTSVEHDTIYALLAIARDTTPRAPRPSREWLDHTQDALERFTQKQRYNVDYNKPYVDVCKDFIQFCIGRSLRTDPSRALDILFRPWATEERKILERRNANIKAKNLELVKQKMAQRRKSEVNGVDRYAQAGTNPKETGQRQKRKRLNNPFANSEENASSQDQETGRKERDKRSNSQSVDGGKMDTEDEYMSLPSWVPQLSGAPFAMYSQAGIPGLKMGRKNADPLVGFPGVTQRNYNAAETKSIDMKTFRFRKRIGRGLYYFSMYVKGFVFDVIAEVQNSSQGGAIPSEWADFGGWPMVSGDPPDEFWRTIVADRGRDGKNPPVYYARACKESFEKGGYVSGSVSTADLINNERCSVIAQFCRRVQAVIWNRALVKTRNGKLGLAGQNVQPGDLVCILYGCSVPVILRQSKKKQKDVMEKEIEWEVQYLKEKLRDCCRTYLERTAFYKRKRKADKKGYEKWESAKREEWKRGKGSKDWRKRWKERTKEQEEEVRRRIVKKSVEILDGKEDLVQHLHQLLLHNILRIEREFNAWKDERRPQDRQWKEIAKKIEAEKNERRRKREEDTKRMPSDDNKIDQNESQRGNQDQNGESSRRQSENDDQNPNVEKKENEKEDFAQGNGSGKAKPAVVQKDTGWNEPKVNWREFELWLKYGRRWKKKVRDIKERLRKDAEDEVNKRWEERQNAKGQKRQKEEHENDTASSEEERRKELTEDGKRLNGYGKEQYEWKLKRNVETWLGPDRVRYYQLLGECYIHGMMDGEAMSVQNGNTEDENAGPIPAQVFEIR